MSFLYIHNFVIFLTLSICPLAYTWDPESLSPTNLTDLPYIQQLTKLEEKLLKNYSREIRPVKNVSTPTHIFFYPLISHIPEFNEKEEKIKISGALYLEWVDEYFTWKKDDYNGLNRLVMNTYYLWKPNLIVYNSVSRVNVTTLSSINTHLWVFSSGRIIWYPLFSFEASCNLDFSSFPYDQHSCPILVGPWSYSSNEMEFEILQDYPDAFMTFNDTKTVVAGWQVVDIRLKLGWWNAQNQTFLWTRPGPDTMSPTGPQFYYFPFVEITPTLRRHAPYFGTIILLPAMVSSLATLFTFWISDFRMKTGVLMANILLQICFSDDLLKILPTNTERTPKIATYYAFNLIMTVLALPLYALFFSLSNKADVGSIPRLLLPLAEKYWNLVCKFEQPSVNDGNGKYTEDNNDQDPSGSKSTSSMEISVSVDKHGYLAWPVVSDALKFVAFVIYAFVYFLFIVIYIF